MAAFNAHAHIIIVYRLMERVVCPTVLLENLNAKTIGVYRVFGCVTQRMTVGTTVTKVAIVLKESAGLVSNFV